MAKNKPMPLEQALQVILSSDGDNPLRAMLEWVVQQALEFEMTEHLGPRPMRGARSALATATATGPGSSPPLSGTWSCSSPLIATAPSPRRYSSVTSEARRRWCSP